MARRASVRYWPSRGGYCCHHAGSQILLAAGPDDGPTGPTFLAAAKRFAELKSGGADGPTLDQVAAEYLERCSSFLQPETVTIRRRWLTRIVEALGETRVSALTPLDVYKWADKGRERHAWSDSTVRIALSALQTCFNWCAGAGLLKAGAFPSLTLPPDGTRGEEYVLSPSDESTVLAAAKGALLLLVQALRDTGARPGEIRAATAAHYRPELQALVFSARARRGSKRHKNARHGQDRVIFLTGETLANVERLVKEHPCGPLFRCQRRGKGQGRKGPKPGWSQDTITKAFRSLRNRTGLKTLAPYSFRHTYAVRALRAGVDVERLATLMGTSAKMIRLHYGHLAQQTDYLRALAARIHSQRDER